MARRHSETTSRDDAWPRTILVAEDEEIVRELVIEVLQGAGYTVLVGENGPGALALFEQHAAEVDVMLLDAVMPGLSGVEVYEQIRALDADVPVLFCSGYGTDTFPPGFFDSEDRHLIAKPYTPRTLLDRIAALLDAHAAASRRTR